MPHGLDGFKPEIYLHPFKSNVFGLLVQMICVCDHLMQGPVHTLQIRLVDYID